MPYTPHSLVTFGGALTEQATADEVWQCGVRGFNPTTAIAPVDPSQFNAYLTAVVTPLRAWFSSANAANSSGATMTWVKIANVGADGKYLANALRLDITPAAGAGTTAYAPSFCSVATSWTTGSTARVASHGRVYPPNFTMAVMGNGSFISSTNQLNLLAAAKAMLSALTQSGSQYAFAPYIVSQQGQQRAITGVKVGNVYDVQRRRKNAVHEVYATGVWP